MIAPLAFVDIETTGLHPDHHEIWEVAMVLRGTERDDGEYLWQLPTTSMGNADPKALDIGGYWERRWPVEDDMPQAVLAQTLAGDVGGLGRHYQVPWMHVERWTQRFSRLTRGVVLVCCNPAFDPDLLARLLRENNAVPAWHHHPHDVQDLAVGYMAGAQITDGPALTPPWSSNEVSRAVGVDPDQFDRHTALGDARWATAMYDAVMGTGIPAETR